MGEQLIGYFENAYKLGGLFAKMRLAMITKIPSTKAAAMPDSVENVNKFNEALNKLSREMNKPSAPVSTPTDYTRKSTKLSSALNRLAQDIDDYKTGQAR